MSKTSHEDTSAPVVEPSLTALVFNEPKNNNNNKKKSQQEPIGIVRGKAKTKHG